MDDVDAQEEPNPVNPRTRETDRDSETCRRGGAADL